MSVITGGILSWKYNAHLTVADQLKPSLGPKFLLNKKGGKYALYSLL